MHISISVLRTSMYTCARRPISKHKPHMGTYNYIIHTHHIQFCQYEEHLVFLCIFTNDKDLVKVFINTLCSYFIAL